MIILFEIYETIMPSVYFICNGHLTVRFYLSFICDFLHSEVVNFHEISIVATNVVMTFLVPAKSVLM